MNKNKVKFCIDNKNVEIKRRDKINIKEIINRNLK
jgi:hypothetical protein